MNITELYSLTKWVEENITKKTIPQMYEVLHQVLYSNSQNNQQQPLEGPKNNLITAIENVPIKQLTKDQLKFLYTLKIGGAIGEEGVSRIEDIFYKNALDIVTTYNKIGVIHNEITAGISKLNQIRDGLKGNVVEEKYEVDNEVLIRVTFTGEAEIANIVQFRDWGKTWYEIGRGIAVAHGTAPEQVKIIGATSGSIVIDITTIPAIAATTATIIFSALKLAEKVLEIKKKAEEIKNLQLQNKKFADELAKEAQKEKEKGIEELVLVVVKQIGIKEKEEGDKVVELEKAIKNLVNFTELGGEVDFVVPEKKKDDIDDKTFQEYEKLKERIQEIRLLEASLKLLESNIK